MPLLVSSRMHWLAFLLLMPSSQITPVRCNPQGSQHYGVASCRTRRTDHCLSCESHSAGTLEPHVSVFTCYIIIVCVLFHPLTWTKVTPCASAAIMCLCWENISRLCMAGTVRCPRVAEGEQKDLRQPDRNAVSMVPHNQCSR